MGKIYSDWFKVDLHIHTDLSSTTKTNDYDGQFDLAILKSKLQENEVMLFSLTDHNIINANCYREYYDSCVEGDPILLIGGEFDINVKQDDDSYLTYHTLLIFSDSNSEMADELSNIIETYFSEKGIVPKERSLTVDEIFELFGKYHFFYIPHAGGHKNIIEAYRGTDITKAQEMVLLMESAHEKVKEKHREKHRKGFDKLKDPAFRNREDEAFVNFSDNHSSNIYPTPKSEADHEFYCLKGEPSFETLRFAFIDPESRIKKQTEVDQLKNVKKYISSIEIKNIADVDDTLIELSPNLNVIIGGASSGKSLLFNLIGKKIHSSKQDFDKYRKDADHVKIKASNSQTFQKDLPFNGDEVIYINQGDIVKFFEKGDLSKLVSDSGKEEDLTQSRVNLNNRKKQFITHLESFRNQFEKLNTTYHKDFIIREDDFKNMLNDKFHFFEVNIDLESIDYEVKQKFLIDLLEGVDEFKNDVVFELADEELEITKKFESLLKIKNKLIQKKENIYNTRISFLANVSAIINAKNGTLESSSRAKSEAFIRKSSLIASCSNLFEESAKFSAISTTLENYEYSEKERIIINESVTLVLEIENKKQTSKYLVSCLNEGDDSRTVYENYLQLVKDNDGLKDYSTYDESRLMQKLQRESHEVLGQFDNPYTYLDYGVNGNSKNKSPGFNAEMYLKTILQQDKCNLVMIDQPEDNLGNTFKNEDLINLLRDYKFKKQIILVSHNPSIVVYGDAENIILAINSQGQISYKQLVLEKKEFQKQIVDNLDGGEVIFDMRSRKYNIKKLLNS